MEVIKTLIKVNQDSVKANNSNSKLPIHLGFKYQSNENILVVLLQCYLDGTVITIKFRYIAPDYRKIEEKGGIFTLLTNALAIVESKKAREVQS